MAIYIKADGATSTSTHQLKLEDLQKAVDGYIETVRLSRMPAHGEQLRLVVNEEALLKGSPYNAIASLMVGGDIFGDAVLCTFKHVGTDDEEIR